MAVHSTAGTTFTTCTCILLIALTFSSTPSTALHYSESRAVQLDFLFPQIGHLDTIKEVVDLPDLYLIAFINGHVIANHSIFRHRSAEHAKKCDFMNDLPVLNVYAGSDPLERRIGSLFQKSSADSGGDKHSALETSRLDCEGGNALYIQR